MKLIMIALVLVGVSANAQVLATVGNAKITADEFNRKLEEVRKNAMNPPTPEQFLEDLVRFEMGARRSVPTSPIGRGREHLRAGEGLRSIVRVKPLTRRCPDDALRRRERRPRPKGEVWHRVRCARALTQ